MSARTRSTSPPRSSAPSPRHRIRRSRRTPARLPCDVPATRFLRPYARSLRRFEPLRLRRLVDELERTVRRRGTYHLWWHPHNFGCDQKENLEFLARFLDRASDLRRSGQLV